MRTAEQDGEFSIWRELAIRIRRRPDYRAVRRTFRATKRFLPNIWRRATQRYRQLPSAVIVGAQKAGTTQLYACLIRHPRCFGGVAKEVQYFSRYADRDLAWYRSRFPLARTVSKVHGLCLEASPSYLPSAEALKRMSEVLPDAKVIALLRDPVARAFSHYQHKKTRQREFRSFAAAIQEEIQNPPCAPIRGWAFQPGAPPLLGYVSRGYYALQIEALLRAYSPGQVLILDSADLFDDANAVCQQVFEFLGLEPYDVELNKIYNLGYYRETIDAATAERLREHYRPHDQLLVELTGRRFRWMDGGVAKAALAA